MLRRSLIVLALLWCGSAHAYTGPGDMGVGTYKAFISCQFAITASYASPGTNVVCALKRDGDGATMNVVMPSGGSVSSTAIAVFCSGAGSSACFVTSATDQTGNGCGFTNSTNPPQLYIDQTSGLMSIFGNFTGQQLSGSCAASTWTVEAVASQDASGSGLSWLLATNGAAAVGFTSSADTAIFSNGSTQTGPSYSLNTYHNFLFANTASGYVNIDGTATPVSGGSGAFATVNLLSDNSNDSGCNCKIGELGIITSVLSSGNQTILESNMAARWGTPTSDGPGTSNGGCAAPPPLSVQAYFPRQVFCDATFANVDTAKTFSPGFNEYLRMFSGLAPVSNGDFSISGNQITLDNNTSNTGQYRARMSTIGNPNGASCCATAASTAVQGEQFGPGGYFEECMAFNEALSPSPAGFPTAWLQTVNGVFAQDFSGSSNSYAANALEIDFPEFSGTNNANLITYLWTTTNGGTSGTVIPVGGGYATSTLTTGIDIIPSKMHCYGALWLTKALNGGTGSIQWYIDRVPVSGASMTYNGSTNTAWNNFAEIGPVELVSDAGYQQAVTFSMLRVYAPASFGNPPMGGLAANDNDLMLGEKRRVAAR